MLQHSSLLWIIYECNYRIGLRLKNKLNTMEQRIEHFFKMVGERHFLFARSPALERDAE
jgi:hypothetical protein